MRKTISGSNMRDVIEQVRLRFGNDALIVSQHSKGGRAEIVVEDGVEQPTQQDPVLSASGAAEQAVSYTAPVAARRSSAGLAPGLVAKATALGFSEKFVSGLDVSIASEAELQSHILARVPLLTVTQPMTGVCRLLGSS